MACKRNFFFLQENLGFIKFLKLYTFSIFFFTKCDILPYTIYYFWEKFFIMDQRFVIGVQPYHPVAISCYRHQLLLTWIWKTIPTKSLTKTLHFKKLWNNPTILFKIGKGNLYPEIVGVWSPGQPSLLPPVIAVMPCHYDLDYWVSYQYDIKDRQRWTANWLFIIKYWQGSQGAQYNMCFLYISTKG